jgi:NAD(P)-dependent dehydrogenase (short-subunit alcohol dehydrogenase family)
MMQDLEGQVAIVTGAAQGIGQEIAATLARHKVKVIIADILDEKGKGVADLIEKEGGIARFLHCDVGDHASIRGLVETVLEEFGRLDIVVNNAYWSAHKSVVDLEEEEWNKSLNVSLRAVYLFGKYAFPAMITAGGGAIVNIASVHGLAAHANYPVYAAAKAGMINLTRQMAVDGGPHRIRVNAICPGWVNTGTTPIPTAILNRALSLYPLQRPGRPEDIANAVLFLTSELSSFVTGSTLVVDGGLTAQLPDSIIVRDFSED